MCARIRFSIPSENFRMSATLLKDEAPQTCEKISRILPIEGQLIHGMMSGNETLIELQGDKKIKLEPENWVYNFVPGDVLYWHSQWGDGRYLKDARENAEIAFIYGRHVKLRDLGLRETAANLFATMDSGLDEFATICRRIRFEGAKKIIIQGDE